MLLVTDEWKQTYPGAAVGILAMRNVANPRQHDALDEAKQELERELRLRYANMDRQELKALSVIQAYNQYYKRFKKTYHVMLQLESIVHEGKSIPSVATLVEAMFMAELKNLLLTAGHDLDDVEGPPRVAVAEGTETYELINGKQQMLKKGDMFISHSMGILSSVVYGPDHSTRIKSETTRVLFTVYVPPDIEERIVWEHLDDIRSNVLIVSPNAEVETREVHLAN